MIRYSLLLPFVAVSQMIACGTEQKKSIPRSDRPVQAPVTDPTLEAEMTKINGAGASLRPGSEAPAGGTPLAPTGTTGGFAVARLTHTLTFSETTDINGPARRSLPFIAVTESRPERCEPAATLLANKALADPAAIALALKEKLATLLAPLGYSFVEARGAFEHVVDTASGPLTIALTAPRAAQPEGFEPCSLDGASDPSPSDSPNDDDQPSSSGPTLAGETLRPYVLGPVATLDTKPAWTWVGHDGGSGSFRYKLDAGDFVETTTTSLHAESALSVGKHTLNVEEQSVAGAWEPVGDFATEIKDETFIALKQLDDRILIDFGYKDAPADELYAVVRYWGSTTWQPTNGVAVEAGAVPGENATVVIHVGPHRSLVDPHPLERAGFLYRVFRVSPALSYADPVEKEISTLTHASFTKLSVVNDEGRDLVLDGNYIYLGQNTAGLRILDVSSPLAPVEAGRLMLNDNIGTLTTAGGFVYLAGTHAHLLTVDARKPEAPVMTAEYPASPEGSGSSRPLIAGDKLYQATGKTLRTFSLADPAHPSLVKEVDLKPLYKSDFFDDAIRVQIHAGLLYLSITRGTSSPTYTLVVDPADDMKLVKSMDFDYMEMSQSAPLVATRIDDKSFLAQIYDITDPFNPVKKGEIDVGDDNNRFAFEGTRLHVISDRKYSLVDVTDPAAPKILGAKDVQNWGPLAVVGRGDAAYIAVNELGVQTVDLTTPTAPAFGANMQRFVDTNAVARSGNIVAVTTPYNGTFLLDLADPIHMTVVQKIDASGTDVALRGSHLYVSSNKGVVTYDVTNPKAPVLVAGGDAVSGSWLKVLGDALFAGSGAQIAIYDLDVAGRATKRVSAPVKGLLDFAVTQDRIYAALGTAGVAAFDHQLKPLGTYTDTAYWSHVAAIGDVAYVIEPGTNGRMRSIRFPGDGTSVALGSYLGLGNTVGMGASQGMIFVADSTRLISFDVTNPASLMVTRWGEGNFMTDVQADSDGIVVTSNKNFGFEGVTVFKGRR